MVDPTQPEAGPCSKRPVARGIFDTFVLWIVSSGLVGIGMLAFDAFRPQIALLGGLLLAVMLSRRLGALPPPFERKDLFALSVLILLALLFRYEPYQHVLGGQDQGTYVNMAAHYEKHGSTFVHDQVRARIRNDEALRYYDEVNHVSVDQPMRHPGEWEGRHFLGLYIKDLDRSEYVFQFFHLHPTWLSMVGSVLGAENGVYALLLFSCLSLVFFYLLARDLHGRTAAVTCVLLLALNPLHAFFSKFPVSEVVALAFSSGGFWYLLRYWRARDHGSPPVLWLGLSVGLFACLFLTHIASLLYLPFFVVLAVLFSADRRRPHRAPWAYLCALFAAYGLSIVYGLRNSFPYLSHIYGRYFETHLGLRWTTGLPLVVALALLAILLIYLQRDRVGAVLRSRWTTWSTLILVGMLLVLAVAVFRSYRLAFTPVLADGSVFVERWNQAGHGWASLPYASLWVAATYLTPVGLLLLLWHFFALRREEPSPARAGLLVFLVVFWFARVALVLSVPYHYYYTRYLFSEVVPYSFLAIALFLAPWLRPGAATTRRLGALAALALVLAWSSYNLFAQFQGRVAEGTAEVLQRIVARVDDDDLLLVDATRFWSYDNIVPALALFYGRNVFAVHSAEDVPALLNDEIAAAGYDEFFVLSQERLQKKWLRLEERADLRYGHFEHVNRVPRSFHALRHKLYLYRVVTGWPSDGLRDIPVTLRPMVLDRAVDPHLEGFHDGVWTDGDGRIVGLEREVPRSCQHLVLVTGGDNPFQQDLRQLQLEVQLNGEALDFVHRAGEDYWFRLPAELATLREIRIRSATFVPSELGTGQTDSRRLGLSILRIELRR